MTHPAIQAAITKIVPPPPDKRRLMAEVSWLPLFAHFRNQPRPAKPVFIPSKFA